MWVDMSAAQMTLILTQPTKWGMRFKVGVGTRTLYG